MTDPVNGDDFSAFVGSSRPAAIAGYPDITVPTGYAGPLPLGVTFIGGRWDEPQLIGLVYAFEEATHVRKPPTFLRSTSAGGRHRAGVAQDRFGHRRMPPLR